MINMVSSDKFTKGTWILIKRYPENIQICPICENLIWTNWSNTKAEKTCINSLEIYITGYIPMLFCIQCNFQMSGGFYLSYELNTKLFFNSYFNEKNKIQNYEDFLQKVSEFCKITQRKLCITVKKQ